MAKSTATKNSGTIAGSRSKTGQVVHLDWHENKEGQVVVVPKDNDRFIVKIRYAVEFLQKTQEFERFGEQFNVLLKMLAEWLTSRSEVKKAYVTLRDGAISFVVVKSSSRYDSTYEDELSDLDIMIANDPDLESVSLTVLSLPPASDEAISAFLDERFTLEFGDDGNRKRPHRTSKREPRRASSTS